MKRLLLISAIGLLATTAPAVAAPLDGVVVANQHGVLLVAGPKGAVRAVRGSARVGARVAVRRGHVRTLGRARRATVRGVVVRSTGRMIFLSAARHIFAVRSPGRRLAAVGSAPSQPQPGQVVLAQVAIDGKGHLDEQTGQNVGQTSQVQVGATVTGVAQGSVTLSVGGQSLTIPLPAGTTLPASVVGTQIQLSVSFAGGQAAAAPPAAGTTPQAGTAPQASGDDQGQDDQGEDDQGESGPSGQGAGTGASQASGSGSGQQGSATPGTTSGAGSSGGAQNGGGDD